MKHFCLFMIFFYNFFAVCDIPFGHDVLLIINFNHPHYDNIPFLKNLYSSQFPNMVFYGSYQAEGIECLYHANGWYSYHVIADAMQKYPQYRGYLFLQDDCVMNVWNVINYDKDSLWRPAYSFVDIENSQARNWSWWHAECGYKAVKHVYGLLSAPDKAQLVSNGGQERVPYGMSDVVYIPAANAKDFIRISNLCFENKLFLELAIPLICSTINKKEDDIILKVFFSWNLNGARSFHLYKATDDFVHPFKFSYKERRDFITKQFVCHQIVKSCD